MVIRYVRLIAPCAWRVPSAGYAGSTGFVAQAHTRQMGPKLRAALYFFAFASALIVPGGRLESQSVVRSLNLQVTEEGQHVVFDLYTLQRRELSKRLPLDQPWPDDEHLPSVFAKYGLNEMGKAEHIPVPSMILPDIYLVASYPTLTYLIDC